MKKLLSRFFVSFYILLFLSPVCLADNELFLHAFAMVEIKEIDKGAVALGGILDPLDLETALEGVDNVQAVVSIQIIDADNGKDLLIVNDVADLIKIEHSKFLLIAKPFQEHND